MTHSNISQEVSFVANKQHLALLKQGIAIWNDWRQKNPKIQPDLTQANFEGENLDGANLNDADLTAANLQGAYLTRSSLERANLENADLEGAYLVETNFKQANLTGANLTGVFLEEANFESANLEAATLEELILRQGRPRPDSEYYQGNKNARH
ncbi:MAG: hypothetical protein DCF15_18940 [Phormidesmis priestleyi]|uniref:Pentapeptide repeat-containing protein n=1 Tax=Phormidesmis priestleyi TaxID=268141 RepID=A0A2W4WSJ3_9CYAN|nr:MAG: hypothetical protein DCF15_18940 [Phormidesmis priestleyi]